MSLADSLLQGSEVADRGGFTVDAVKAKEKLERFRLADPLLYIVELMQAAVLGGANDIKVSVDADDVEVRFTGGRRLERDDLENLESTILVRKPGTHPATQQLALAISAAQGLHPRFIRLSAGGHRLEMRGEERSLVEDSTTGNAPKHGPHPVHFHLKEAPRLGHVVDFLRGVAGRTREANILKERCAYAHITIEVNGKVISGQPGPSPLAVDVVRGQVRVRVGFLTDVSAPSRLILLRAGAVQEETLWLKESKADIPSGLFAIVDGGALDRDASFVRFIRDDAFARVVAAADQAIVRLATLLVDDLRDEKPLAIERARRLVAFLGRDALGGGKGRTALREANLLRDPAGGGVSLHDLTKTQARSQVVMTLDRAYTKDDVVDGDNDGDGRKDNTLVVHVRDDLDRAIIRGLKLSAADASKMLATAQERRRKRRDFENRRRSFVPPKDAIRTLYLESETEKTILALRSDGAESLTVQVLVNGSELAVHTIPCAVPGLTISLHGKFTPTAGYDDVVRDVPFADAMRRAVNAIPELLNGPYDPVETGRKRLTVALRALLPLAIDGDALWQQVRVGLRLPTATNPAPIAVLPLTGSKAHGVVTVACLQQVPGGLLSIESLLRGRDPVGVVTGAFTDFVPSVSPTVVVEERIKTVLTTQLGSRHRLLNDEQQQAELRKRFRDARNVSPRRLDGVLAAASFEHTEMAPERGTGISDRRLIGEVGFRPQQNGAQVTLHHAGRQVERRLRPSPLAGLVMIVDDNGLRFGANLQPENTDHLMPLLLQQVPHVVEALGRARHVDAWLLGHRLVELVLPTPSAARGQRIVSRRQTAPATAAIWRAILRLIRELKDDVVESAFASLIAENAVISESALRQKLPRRKREVDPDPLLESLLSPVFDHPNGIVAGLLEHFSLGDLLVRRLDGTTVTLRTLVERHQEKTLRHVSVPGPAPKDFDDVICDPGAIPLLHLLCTGGLENVDKALAQAQAQAAFSLRQVTTPTIPKDARTLLVRTIDTAHMQGELGLQTGAPTSSPQAEIDVLLGGRPLTRVSLGQNLGVSLVGAINVEHLTPLPDFSGLVHDDQYTAFVDRLRDQREAIIATLLDDVEAGRASVETPAVRARLLERIRLARTSKKIAVPTKGLTGQLCAIEMWRTVGGVGQSLRALAAMSVVRILDRAHSGEIPEGFDDVIVVTDVAERYVLSLLVETTDVESDWAEALETARHKARLGPLPVWPASPPPLLCAREVRLGKAILRLGIAAIGSPKQLSDLPNSLIVGADAVVVERMPFPADLPALGVLDGISVVRKDFRAAQLNDGQRASLGRESVNLWRDVLAKLDTFDGDDKRWLQDALAILTLHLASQDAGALSTHVLGFRAQLRRAPVFRLWHGGTISLEDALVEDPGELRVRLRRHGFEPARPVEPVPQKPSTEGTTGKGTKATGDAPPSSSAKDDAVDVPPPSFEAEPEAPPPPEPTAADRLRSHLEDLLHTVHGGPLTSRLELSRVDIVEGNGKTLTRTMRGERVQVDANHPLAKAADGDGAALLLVATSVVTRLNALLAQYTDDHEQAFLVSLARHALTMTPD